MQRKSDFKYNTHRFQNYLRCYLYYLRCFVNYNNVWMFVRLTGRQLLVIQDSFNNKTILLSKANSTVNWFVIIAAELGTVLGQVDHSAIGMLAVSTQRHSINTFMSTEKRVIWAWRRLGRILDNSSSILGRLF